MNDTRGAVDGYVRGLDANGYDDSQSVRYALVPQHSRLPRRNPEMDYTKLIIMVGGAIAVGIIYDQVKKRKNEA